MSFTVPMKLVLNLSIKPLKIRSRIVTLGSKTGVLRKRLLSRKLKSDNDSIDARIFIHAPDDFMHRYHIDVECEENVITPFEQTIGAALISTDKEIHLFLTKPIKIKNKEVTHLWFNKNKLPLPPGRYRARIGYKSHYGEYGFWIGLDKNAHKLLEDATI